ncbi:HAMP domain-containing sensor histidine kinase [Thermotalea metallivorans]|uniref:histidine kinase n=1 Tax=Thermotalea metallivorans TaxID=520762 RepID=A0A140L6X0_9FIRM|nr:HAMP domain-containing sensor histidine kinase [Thermotalea metallivorans]KXG76295.1 Signal transduction histidine-protein kinase BaeS [Thermotalea metallivorans]
MGKNLVHHLSIRKQFILFSFTVMILSFVFTLITYILFFYLINTNILLRSDYHVPKVQKLRDFVYEKGSLIFDQENQKVFDALVHSTNIKYEVRNFNGDILYSNTGKPLDEQRQFPSEEKTITRLTGKVTKYIPVYVDNHIQGYVLIQYYLRVSFPDPRYNFLALFLELFTFFSPLFYLVLFIIIFAKLFSKHINIPMKELIHAAEKIRNHDLDFTIAFDADNEIGLLCRAFEKMRKELHDSLIREWRQEEERRDMIRALSHDLRTPLTIIKGHAEVLINKSNPDIDMIKRYLSSIEKNTDYMIGLIENINELSKMENPDFTLRFRLENIIHFIETKAKDFQTLAFRKKISLSVKINDVRKYNHPFFIDPVRLSQVMDNILSNSIRFTPENGCIAIHATIDDHKAHFEITDSGPGFSKRDLANLFKKFYQGDLSRSQEKGHAGIGLYLCKIIIEKHKGSITARNSDRGGACIEFIIPSHPENLS